MHLISVWVLYLLTSAYANISPDFPSKVIVQAVAQSTKSNVVVSPYSLIAPLGTLSLASVYSTRREILDLFGVEENNEIRDSYENYKKIIGKLQNVTLYSANKIYITDTSEINHLFNTRVHEIFDIDVQSIDFTNVTATKAECSRWIKEKTDGIVYWSLKPTPNYKAAIVNAVFLDAPWTAKFELSGSHKFQVNETKTINVYYMTKNFGIYHAYTEKLHAEVFKVPYEGNECSFVGVVPYVMNDVTGVLQSLANDGNVLNKILESEMTFKYVNLTMPLFDIIATIDVKQLLQNLGVQKIFEDAKLYHLLKGTKQIYVNEARQKIVLSVNVDGTQAAASNVPVVQKNLLSLVPPKVNVVVDHPFYFEIRCSDITLINGVIRNPMTHFKYNKILKPNL